MSMTGSDKKYLELRELDSNLAQALVDKWVREGLQELVRELGSVMKILGISPDVAKFRIADMMGVSLVRLKTELRTKNSEEFQKTFGEKV